MQKYLIDPHVCGGNLFNLLAFRAKKKEAELIEDLTERQISWLYFTLLLFCIFYYFHFVCLKVGRLLANGHGEYDSNTAAVEKTKVKLN